MRLLIILTLLLGFTSCGKKGVLEKPQDYKRPTFDNVIAK